MLRAKGAFVYACGNIFSGLMGEERLSDEETERGGDGAISETERLSDEETMRGGDLGDYARERLQRLRD